MTEKFDEFMDDIIQDMRKAKIEKIWNKYKVYILSALTVAITTTAGYSIWEYYKESRQTKLANKLVDAQRLIVSNDYDQAIKTLSEIQETSSAYGMLAKFLAASAYISKSDNYDKDNLEAALKIYEDLSVNKNVPSHIQELAKYLKANLQVISLDQQQAIDEKHSEEILKLLPQIDALIGPDKPWNALALELKGYILYKVGNLEQASEAFSILATKESLSDIMAMRAQFMSKIIAQELS